MMQEMFRLRYSARMSAEKEETAELSLWGEIVPNKDIFALIFEPAENQSSSEFKKAVDELRQKGATRLLLRINSPGGVVNESVAMRSILANAGFKEITIRIEGLCASAATNIATLPGARVEIAEGSEYMIHNPWTVAIGFASDLEHTADRLRNMEKTSRGFYMAKSGQNEEQVKAWMDEETWFTAEEAVEYGFCDELLKAEDGQADAPAVACVSARDYDVMKSLYAHVPAAVAIGDRGAFRSPPGPPSAPAENSGMTNNNENSGGNTNPEEDGSNENPVAGISSVINDSRGGGSNMEIRDITREQLLAENPALAEEIAHQAVEEERERVSGIDAVTMPGYEQEAEEAKASGVSIQDFIRNMVQKSRQKGRDFMAARQQETAPAQQVTGGAAEDDQATEEDEIQKEAKLIAEEAARMMDTGSGMF